MARTIDCFFTTISPWAYLGHAAFVDLAERHGLSVRYRPVALVESVYPASGGLPVAKRHPSRLRYRDVELQRWRAKRGVPFNLRPKHWPFDPTLLDCIVVALAGQGGGVDAFLLRAFSGIFAEERDLSDPRTVADLLTAAGFDAPAVMKAAVDPATTALYDANTRDALGAGVFGSPSYVLDGEVFWGQDRLELLDDALASGRASFHPKG